MLLHLDLTDWILHGRLIRQTPFLTQKNLKEQVWMGIMLWPCRQNYLITLSSISQSLENIHEGNHPYTAEILRSKPQSVHVHLKLSRKPQNVPLVSLRRYKQINVIKILRSNIRVDGSTCCFIPFLFKLKHSCKTLILWTAGLITVSLLIQTKQLMLLLCFVSRGDVCRTNISQVYITSRYDEGILYNLY